MARTPLSTADTVWLRMEDPANLMMVTGVLMFSRRVDFGRLKDLVRERMLAYPRFSQRVVEAPFGVGPPQWLTTRGFDLDAHLHHVAVPEPGDKLALEEFVSDLTSTPLDFSKPPWQVHLVDQGPGSVVGAHRPGRRQGGGAARGRHHQRRAGERRDRRASTLSPSAGR